MSRNAATNQFVMIVEDDFFIRDMLIELLEDEGYSVVSAANGREALTYLQEAVQLPALILLDLMMPIMDGRQFRHAQQRVATLQAVPVVVLTASSDNEKLPPDFQPAAYVAKPINLQQLLTTVAEYCQHSPCSS